MKQKFNFVTCWRHFSGEIKVAFSTTKMAPTGGEIKFLCHRTNPKFPSVKQIIWISLVS